MSFRDLQITTQKDTGTVAIKLFETADTSTENKFIPLSVSSVSNLSNLSQRIIKKILTAKGSSYNFNFGCDFQTVIGTYDSSNIDEIKEIVPIIIDDISEQIKKEQIELELMGCVYEPDEQLVELQIGNLTFEEAFGGWKLDLKIITNAGSAYMSVI